MIETARTIAEQMAREELENDSAENDSDESSDHVGVSEDSSSSEI